MRYASIILDIPTRALDAPFSYAIPEELEAQVSVGCTVLVTFSGRAAIGYVIAVSNTLPPELDANRVLPVDQVLASAAFDATGAAVATWMAKEYACNACDALRPFLAPGQRVRVTQDDEGVWHLVNDTVEAVDDRWVALTARAEGFTPRKGAKRQAELLSLLNAGPQRMAELRVTLGNVASTVRALEDKGVVEVLHRRLVRGGDAVSLSSALAPRHLQLTDGQQSALAAIGDAMEAGQGDVVVVDGVTGSGKTEVYLRAIEQTLRAGKGAIVLVPEISLTAQTVGRFRSRFGDRVAVLHSRLSAGERFDQWDLVRQGIARVVVGARSALFAPLFDPGVIIIDEEHEGSYKQDSAPRYHARDIAARLARERGCALVLGSATPSLESLGRCHLSSWGGVSWTHVSMPERPGTALLPQVQVVDMTTEFRNGGRSIFSAALTEGLRQVASRREKAVLLLNRRGFANFLMCRECGCVPECPHCSTSLTYHERTHSLVCHTCDRRWPMTAWPDTSTRCPNCGSRYMGAFGVGTQRVEDELAMLFAQDVAPERHGPVEIIRMDADTTRGKGAHDRLLERFDSAECAVLVGTQMIAKGLDFPEVTLVGVINADTMLKLPDFRSAERTYDLLEQVAGRAGRGERAGRVIVQSYWAGHPAIQAVARHDRSLFLEPELQQRRTDGYPPFARLSNVIVWGTNPTNVRTVSEQIASRVRDAVGTCDGWELLGPADCVRAKVKDRVRRHVVLKSPYESSPGELLNQCVRATRIPPGVNVAIDVDAHDLL